MELHKAIKEIVASKGAEMIGNIQIINYLLDYQAFKEKPATKLILRAIIDSGYAENILALINTAGWETKFKQYQHEFIDSCGYKEELAAYVFESIAYGLGIKVGNEEPEIKSPFNVDSFFDVPEVEQPQQPTSTPNQNQQNTDPTDLYTIAISFYNEGKYQQAKGFIEKALAQYPQSSVPALYLKLMGDVHMKLDRYQEAIKYYNECFVRKATELKVTVDNLRDSLKKHEVKEFENSIFCYYFCLYSIEKFDKPQWRKLVKEEALYGLNDAIMYCVENGINPMDKHINIFFTDKSQLRTGDYLYPNGSFSHELSSTKKPIAKVFIVGTTDYEQKRGWTHGYLIPVTKDGFAFYIKNVQWSTKKEDLQFPHSHYTNDDLNHWDKLKTIESEPYITIDDYETFPAFKAVRDFAHKIPISGTSQWFLPSIHWFKRTHFDSRGDHLWTSSQANNAKAIYSYSSWGFRIEDKTERKDVLPVVAF